MRRFFKIMALGVFCILLVGVVAALSMHAGGGLDGAAIAIDDQRIEGPMMAIAIGAIVAFALFVALVVVAMVSAAVLACVAIIVPLALAIATLAVVFALIFGLAPLLVPVLLLVGACVLLARWIRRPRAAPPPSRAAV